MQPYKVLLGITQHLPISPPTLHESVIPDPSAYSMFLQKNLLCKTQRNH